MVLRNFQHSFKRQLKGMDICGGTVSVPQRGAQQRKSSGLEKELNDEDDESSEAEPAKPLSTKQSTEFFKHINIAIGITDDNGANRHIRSTVTKATESTVVCYKEFYSKRQKAAYQHPLYHFFKRAENCQSTCSGRQ
jgi:hypothetical protein